MQSIYKFIQLLQPIIPEEFGLYDGSNTFDYKKEINAAAAKCFSQYKICHGSSRVVIVIPELSKVIKIPFSCKYDIDGDRYWFQEANDWNESNSCTDYNENEIDKYSFLLKEGYGDMFAATQACGEVASGIIEVQELVTPCDDCGYEISAEGYASYRKHQLTWSTLGKEVTALLSQDYGEERVTNLCKMADDFNFLSDIHMGNLGYDLQGRLKIIDFAGWREDL